MADGSRNTADKMPNIIKLESVVGQHTV